jgi:hypothetical protein
MGGFGIKLQNLNVNNSGSKDIKNNFEIKTNSTELKVSDFIEDIKLQRNVRNNHTLLGN